VSPVHPHRPLTATVTPADQAAVADEVRRAYETGTTVYPIGGGTSPVLRGKPGRPGLGLSLAGMAQVIDHPARDLTITAQAGITIAVLAERLAAQRQRLPVDVPHPDRATLGGVAACNTSGPRRYAFGTMRDFVIGLSAVDGCGRIFSGGGRVVKNAAGYDLCRLLVGSRGALGVITQVTLMVKPIPESTVLAVCEVPDLDAAERVLAGLAQSKALPVAVEFLAGPAWQGDPLLGPASGSALGRVVVGLEGTAVEVEWMIGQLADEIRACGVAAPHTVMGRDADSLWKRLAGFPAETTADDGRSPLVVRISVLPGGTTAMIGRLLEIDRQGSIQAHAGNGVICARLAMLPDQVAGVLADRLRPAAAALAGHVTVRSAPPEAGLSRRDVWGPVGDGAAVMQAIKDRFDPKGILNPGHFVFADR
jgi:glycolate oxidase FAD binding subunit